MKMTRKESLLQHLAVLLAAGVLLAACKAEISKEREAELSEVRLKYVFNYLGSRGTSGAVLNAMGAFPRHRMLPEEQWNSAYQDAPLVTEDGKQYWPGMAVGLALSALEPGKGENVLVLGAQDGWAVGILCQLGAKVTFWDPSARHGAHMMKALQRVEYDGYDPSLIYFEPSLEKALAGGPYKRVFVAGAVTELPEAWKMALAPEGGRLVVPEGLPGATDLYLVGRSAEVFDKVLLRQASLSYLLSAGPINYGKLFRQ